MFPVDAIVLLYLIFFTPALAAWILIGWLRFRWKRRFSQEAVTSVLDRPWIIRAAVGYLLLYAACFLYAWKVEPYWVDVTRTEIPVSRPVLGYDRFRIVQLSDLHLDLFGPREKSVLEEIRKAEPHLILLTGDYLNTPQQSSALREFLRNLSAPHGVYAVEGNWDWKVDLASLFAESAKERGEGAGELRLLKDDYRLLTREGQSLLLLGSTIDPALPPAELLKGTPAEAYRILLHHMPEGIDHLPPGERIDLFLCGHTHGGQVRLPFWGAVITLSKYHKKYEMGRYRVGETEMYVHRGVGMEGGPVPRVRFLCRPEVAVIDLAHKP